MRRARIGRIATALLALSCFGCESHVDRAPRRDTTPSRARAPAGSQAPAGARPLEFVERCIGASCDATLPTLVVIHGLGDTPEAFITLYSELTRPVRVLALRAPLDWGDGFAWFPYRAMAASSSAGSRRGRC